MLKYTIVCIDDRAADLIEKNKRILGSFENVTSIPFFNGNSNDPLKELNSRNFNVPSWTTDGERSFDPLPGELGIWISYLNIFEYIIETNTPQMLVIEDDAILADDSVSRINDLILEIPSDWDFLSLHYSPGQNELNEETDIGSNKIHKSTNQVASTVGIIYSYSGAKKFLNLVKEKGLETTIDCFLYKQHRLGLINGYSVIPSNDQIITHDSSDIISTIDPNNLRNPIAVVTE